MKQLLYFLIAVIILSVSSCTKLDEGIYDRYVADQFYATPAGAEAALADIYKEMRGDWGGIGVAGADRGWYDLNETCTDEMMIPTRSDGAWADNGIWIQMYTHTWTAGQAFIDNTWNWLYRAIFKANLAIELLTKAKANEAFIAEAKVLRAFFYYLLLDGWGNVPIVTDSKTLVKDVNQSSRTEVYNFVVRELTENIDKLHTPTASEKQSSYYNRFHKWVGYTILAKVYLNAQVYTGTARFNEALNACNRIINEGGYSLIPGADYLDRGSKGLFGQTCNTQETIFGIFIDGEKAPRNIIGIRTLYGPHGNALFGFSTWNGATVHQDFYNKYNAQDIRRQQWLVGPQPGSTNYSLNISSLTSAGVQEGARNAKFLPVPPYNGGAASNDFPVYRFADIILMKAECLLRTGNVAAATEELNKIRNRAGLPNFTGTLTLDEIYDERGRELCWEGHRRQDMIRFGKFLQPHDFKTSTSPSTYILFPIPASAIAANPTLRQNPGY
ncbi:MAG: RagB/SusD family nutrient uptake outer membrane protein [Bacteroidia bacterium]|nr:RagB/SusD family nutrient uptake outer membrane protein [Bacteroidia bacterium]MDW8300854.1 RagB/SusD family nutrient uptake outer membrane protein [Bacteroidia bacterium]